MQKLTKPSSGYIAIQADGSPVALEFGGGNASLQKDGDNLVFAFEDGTSSVVQDFYKNGKDAVFIIDGQEIPAQALFEAMNASDIMPAAGGDSPSAGASPKNHHGSSYEDAALLAGTWSLRELDIHFDSANQTADTLNAVGGYDADRDETGSGSEPEPAPSPEPSPEPAPESYAVSAGLDIPSVFEGQPIVGRVVLDNPPKEDCTVQIRIGDVLIDVPVPAGAAEASFSVENPNGEDPFTDASSVEAEIVSITGGGYDSSELEAPSNVDILDTIDTVTFSIIGEAVDETAETARFTITSDDPVQTGSLAVNAVIGSAEYAVDMHWTDNGWVGYVDVPVRENDLLINGKDTVEAYVASAKHDAYEWENPDYGKATEATVIDNKDDAVFNTAITVEDGQYVVEVTSAQPNSDEGHPSLTLTVNGENRQIDLHWDDAREMWTESVSFDLPAPTHSDETVHVEASISDPSMLGLEYENPICNPAVKDIVVEHEPWHLNAHLEVPSVFEGNVIAGKIVLDKAPFDDGCIAAVKVGDATVEVPIPANAAEVEFTVENPNTEDPFIDASEIQAEIVSITGGGYDSVALEDPITVSILDTIDEVKFAITGESVDETAETMTFTVTSDDPVQTDALTVVANIDGNEYSVDMELANGSWIGHVEVPVRENDLLINGKDTIEAYVVSAKHDSYEWENPDYGKATEAAVIDNVDDAVFNTAITASNGQYVVEVTSAQPNSSNGYPTLTLTVNGESQQINLHWDEARELWVESVSFDLPAPTHSDETVHVEASISNPSMLGLQYENPICNPAAKDIVVEHEYWPVNAHLEVPSVFEGNEIAGKVILDNAPVDDCIATVKVGDATVEVPVEAGKTEASFAVDNPNTEDPFIDASSVQAEIVSIDGGRYDEINIEDPINVDILDTIDEVKFAITGQNVDETAETMVFTITSDDPVQTGSLTVTASIDGAEYTVPMEWTESGWTGQVEVPVRENDLLINGKDTIEAYVVSAQHDSYEWENPDYGKATEATVIDNKDDAVFNTSITVNETAYVVEVTSVQPNSTEGHPTLTLTVNGESQQIDLHWDDARELWVESIAFDLPAHGINDETLHVEASISDPSMKGLEYENPILNSAETDIFIEHEPYNFNAHLEIPSVFEGSDIVGTIVLDNPPREDCTALVKVGDTLIEVHLPANAVEVEFTVENPNTEDPFIDASFVNAEIVSIEGGGYDERTLDDPIRVDILDTIDEVKFAITGQHVDEAENAVVFSIESTDPVQTGSLSVLVDVEGTEHTVQMEWKDGGWKGELTVPIRGDDLLVNGRDTYSAYIVSASHDNWDWENPNYGEETESTVIDNLTEAVFDVSIKQEDGRCIVKAFSAQPEGEGSISAVLTVNGTEHSVNLVWDSESGLWKDSLAFDLPAATVDGRPIHVEASLSDPLMNGIEYENPVFNSDSADFQMEAGASSASVDETFIHKGSHYPEDEGSDSASIFLGGSSSLFGSIEWSLSIDSQPQNVKAVFDGLERDVFLVDGDDGSVIGRIQVSRNEIADVFKVSVDDEGNATFALLGSASLFHSDPTNSDEAFSISCISAHWKDGDLEGTKTLNLEFQDDAPWIGVVESHPAGSAGVVLPSGVRNLIDCGPAIDFTHGTAGARFHNDIDGLQFWAAEGVTLSPGILQYEDDGWTPVDIIGVKDTQEHKTHWLQYSGHNSNANKPWNWGLDVHSGAGWEHGKEISHEIIHHQGQAVIVDLNGHLAYGITVEFGACYDPKSSVMANDRQFPEAATVVFYRNGENVGWESATGLSSGEDERTFGASILDGFDRAVISVPDNHSLDPNKRGRYPDVSDNEFTIRKIDFSTHPQEVPIRSYEGTVEIHESADGWQYGEKNIAFWQDQMGDHLDNVVLADGTSHTVSIAYESGNTNIFGYLEDGTVLFTAIVESSGEWRFSQWQDFTVKGEDSFELQFRTGIDFDGDWAHCSSDVQTSGFADDVQTVPFTLSIESTDAVLPDSSWYSVPVSLEVDEDVLNGSQDSWIEIAVSRGSETEVHSIHWNGNGFDPSEDGFLPEWDGGVLSWQEDTPEIGTLLAVNAIMHWTDDAGMERTTSSFAAAQRDINGTPPEPEEIPPLLGTPSPMLFSASADIPAEIPDAGQSHSDTDLGMAGSELPYSSSASSELDAAMLTTAMSQGG